MIDQSVVAPPAAPAAPPARPALKDVAGSVYGPLITGQLDQERARKSSIETRAVAIGTSSAFLLGLFTGLLTLIEGKDFRPPITVLIPIGLAYVLFVAAGVTGVVANAIGNSLEAYGEFHVPTLREWTQNWDSLDSAGAGQQIANEQLNRLSGIRGENLKKWRLLLSGVVAEVTAVLIFVAVLAGRVLHLAG